LGIGPGARTLEVGCGNDWMSAWLAELVVPSGHVVAVDRDLSLTDDRLHGRPRSHHDRLMNSDSGVEVSALAINVTIPEALRWTDRRRGKEFTLTTLNVRLLPDGHLAVKAYGRPTGGGRGAYVPFPVVDRPELPALIADAAHRASAMWGAHRGLPSSATPGDGK
jgi:hypothetical protein